MIASLVILSIIGLAICAYGLFLEKKIKEDPTYKPACDLSDKMSCSQTLLSSEGKIFGYSPIYFGTLYYFIFIIVSLLNLLPLSFLLSCVGIIASVAYAYIGYFKIKTICPLCTSLYIINIIMFFISCSLFFK